MASDATVNIIRKIEVVEGHGHHGGAWKVAYADFMTAMMAFFLLMWILSSSDEQKLRGIAEYFTNATLPGGSGVLDGATLGPPGTLTASNGTIVARGAELGEIDDPTPAKWEVMDTTPTADPEQKVRGTTEGHHENPAAGAASETFVKDANPEAGSQKSNAGTADVAADSQDPMNAAAATAQALGQQADVTEDGKPIEAQPDHTADEERFEALESKIKQAMQEHPDLKPLQDNILFEKTPEGMRIQIVDQKGQPMFSSGSAKMTAATQKLMALLGDSLTQLPNDMVISGHTDAVPFSNKAAYDNWDLSSDRANAMRRVLLKSGVEQERITRVSGMAATQLLKPDAPKDASNRRIEVLLAYEAPITKPEPVTPSQPDQVAPATQVATTATAPNEAAPVEEAPTSVVAEVLPEASATVLDENVFENLRSALR
jgi:chemotaxis protein MotB